VAAEEIFEAESMSRMADDFLHAAPPEPDDAREERIALHGRRQHADADPGIRCGVQFRVGAYRITVRLDVVIEEQQNPATGAAGAFVASGARTA
jgi:hypothetical protein